jgi:hypothetical protein
MSEEDPRLHITAVCFKEYGEATTVHYPVDEGEKGEEQPGQKR